jgi:hypothetical protein
LRNLILTMRDSEALPYEGHTAKVALPAYHREVSWPHGTGGWLLGKGVKRWK